MTIKFLLVLLPTLAVARINIEVSDKFDSNNNNVKIQYTGEDVAVISDQERRSFNLGDANLKMGVEKFFGKRPNDAYIRSPTPWGDLYTTFGWNQVTRTLKPVSAKILQVSSEPSVILRRDFVNNSTLPATFNVGISQTVQNTVRSSWTIKDNLNVESEIKYAFDIGLFNAGGSTSISYTSSWGKEYEQSTDYTVGSSSDVSVLLQPGQSVLAELQATKGSMQIEIEYEARLSGTVALNYDDAYRGHHFWSLDVNSVIQGGGLKDKLMSKEVIDIGFYSNGRIIVSDKKTNVKLLDRKL